VPRWLKRTLATTQLALLAALSGWLPLSGVGIAAGAGLELPGQGSLVELTVPVEGVDPRLVAIVSVIAGIPLSVGDGETATFLVPAGLAERYRDLLMFLLPVHGAGTGPGSGAPRTLFDDPTQDTLIVRFHPGVSRELADVLAAVYRSRVLGDIERLNAYLLARPHGLTMEEFMKLLLLSPLVSAVEPNTPVTVLPGN